MNKICLFSVLVFALTAINSAQASSFCYNYKQGSLGMSLVGYEIITSQANCPSNPTEELTSCQECLKKEAGNIYYYYRKMWTF